jgi:hypothetical protein
VFLDCFRQFQTHFDGIWQTRTDLDDFKLGSIDSNFHDSQRYLEFTKIRTQKRKKSTKNPIPNDDKYSISVPLSCIIMYVTGKYFFIMDSVASVQRRCFFWANALSVRGVPPKQLSSATTTTGVLYFWTITSSCTWHLSQRSRRACKIVRLVFLQKRRNFWRMVFIYNLLTIIVGLEYLCE